MYDENQIVTKIEDAVWCALEQGWTPEKIEPEVRAAIEGADS